MRFSHYISILLNFGLKLQKIFIFIWNMTERTKGYIILEHRASSQILTSSWQYTLTTIVKRVLLIRVLRSVKRVDSSSATLERRYALFPGIMMYIHHGLSVDCGTWNQHYVWCGTQGFYIWNPNAYTYRTMVIPVQHVLQTEITTD